MERESLKEGLVHAHSSRSGEDPATDTLSSSLTPTVVLSTAVVASSCFAYGCASVYSSPAESGIMGDLGLTIAEYSVFGSILTIGGMAGALISGKLADSIGRRPTMWVVDTVCIIGWLAIIFAKDAWWLNIGRFFMGIGFGITLYAAQIYMAEITPENIRGGCSAVPQLMICCGASLVFFIGNFINWRALAIIGTLPCVLQAVGTFFIPESPRWLAKIGKEEEVVETLNRLRGKNVDVSLEAAEIMDYTLKFQVLSESIVFDLFDKKYARVLTIGAGLMLLVQFGGIAGITSYESSILERAGASASIGTTAVAIIQIPCSVLSVFLMDNIGRRPLLMVGGIGACLANFLIALGFLLQDLNQMKELTAMLTLVGILIFSASMYIGLNAPWIIISEIFPINIKGPAGSFVTFVNWITSWIVSYTFNFLLEWSSAGVFFIFACICGSIVVFAAKLVPETKGRTLEEIQTAMTSN